MNTSGTIKGIMAWRPSFEKSVGIVLFRDTPEGRKFLLLHYPHGHWDFVKGHTHDRETEHETARREMMEETGITDVEIFDGFREVVYFSYIAKGTERSKRVDQGSGLLVAKQVVYFIGKTKMSDILLSDEHIFAKWLSAEGALELITHQNSKQLMKKAVHFLEKK